MTDAQTPVKNWPLWLLSPLMVVGMGVGVYMTRHHDIEIYGGEELQAETLVGCAESSTVNCDIVNTSAWSEVFGVPLYTWAIATYAAVLVWILLTTRGKRGYAPLITLTGLGATLFSAFLFYISKVELGYVCSWCIRTYGINLAILGLGGLQMWLDRKATGGLVLPKMKSVAAAAFIGIIAIGVAISGERSYRASLLLDAPVVAELPDDVPEPEVALKDPEGPAPVLSFTVKTEDGNEATLSTTPDDHWKGNPDAKVAIVEFADFECGYCKRAGFQLKRLFEAYKDDVVMVYKHFPMDPACNSGVNNKKHRRACVAHAASVCAADQGMFWAYHDLLYKNNHQLGDENLMAYARKLGLDESEFVSCMRDGKGYERVKATGAEGAAVDVHGTPRIFINGQLYRSGSSAEQMARAIETALGRSGSEVVENARALREVAPEVEPIPADVPEMQRITYGGMDFMIDTFESSLDSGKAVSGKHLVPGTRMSWYAANDACKAAGKRMCSESEWIAACQAAAPVDDNGNGQTADDMIEGTAYPYGDLHTKNLCWENHEANPRLPADQQPSWRPVYTGEMPGCVTPDGVYDMTGNVEEWVGTTAEEAVLLGGAFDTPDDKARCYRRNPTFGAGYSNIRTGFRCCANAN